MEGSREIFLASVASSKTFQEKFRGATTSRPRRPLASKPTLLGVGANWRCDDVRLFIDRVDFEQLGLARAGIPNAVPTRFVLPAEQVEILIEGGAGALRQSRSYQAFRRGL